MEPISDIIRKYAGLIMGPGIQDGTGPGFGRGMGLGIGRGFGRGMGLGIGRGFRPGIVQDMQQNMDNPDLEKDMAPISKMKGFVTDIEKDTVENDNFRKVLYTGKNMQLVLMSLKSGEDIGEEVHNDTDQFLRVDSGEGKVIINDKEHDIKDGSAFIIPQGSKHNVICTGKKPLKLYSIYCPPHHKDKVIHKLKKDALLDDEHFDGKITEGPSL
jgi:mannose-6-phosphate isomerase-like protein (cupin superfamily)